jgi:transcriptional regulator GlxA family with amidase domain
MAGPRHDVRVPAPLVLIAGFDDVEPLDVAGPAQVFSHGGRYRVELVARGGSMRAESGFALGARDLAPVRSRVDTLIVAGGRGIPAAVADAELVAWIAATAARARRVTSVCTGAFLLAEAGLLRGRRATTHWARCDRLAAEYPDVEVDPEPIFVRDGDVWTSAGVTAGMDLALALVADDHGPAVALEVARWLVMYVQRPGGQAQFSAQLAVQAAERRPLRDLQGWIADHLADDLTVPALAERAGMSVRHFSRAFRAEVGVTPAAYVERVRLEAARRRLEEHAATVDQVARECGFGRAEVLHRAFRRRFATTPAQYRRHFRPAA